MTAALQDKEVPKMKVWAVWHGQYSDICLDGLFSTPEKAEFYKEIHNQTNRYDDARVECIEIDALIEMIARETWSGNIDIKTGNIDNINKTITIANKNWRTNNHNINDYWKNVITKKRNSITKTVCRVSYISEDHLIKVLAETRQEFLRIMVENGIGLSNLIDTSGKYYYNIEWPK